LVIAEQNAHKKVKDGLVKKGLSTFIKTKIGDRFPVTQLEIPVLAQLITAIAGE
jgi:hypothetical protein